MKFDTKYEWATTHTYDYPNRLKEEDHEDNSQAGWILIKEMYVGESWVYWWKKAR